MSAFSQLKQSDGTLVDFEPKVAPPPKRPRRWALSNWPVRWKVFAIVLVPLVLAGALGGLRIYSSVTEATDLRRAADHTEMAPAIVNTSVGSHVPNRSRNPRMRCGWVMPESPSPMAKSKPHPNAAAARAFMVFLRGLAKALP